MANGLSGLAPRVSASGRFRLVSLWITDSASFQPSFNEKEIKKIQGDKRRGFPPLLISNSSQISLYCVQLLKYIFLDKYRESPSGNPCGFRIRLFLLFFIPRERHKSWQFRFLYENQKSIPLNLMVAGMDFILHVIILYC